MRLTLKQKGALVRLHHWIWMSPWMHARTNHARGVLRQGWMRTCWSLEKKKLIRYLRKGDTRRDGETVDSYNEEGYELTDEGLRIAKELSAIEDTRIMREATRTS